MDMAEVGAAAEGIRHSLGSVGGKASMETREEAGGRVKGGGGTDNGGVSEGVGAFETKGETSSLL